jgi:Calcium binding
MTKVEQDEEREERITMEIVVDAYDAAEQAMGWYCYLENTMQFPFMAVCISKRRISPVKENVKVKVVGMPSADECEHEMFVEIEWDGDTLAVPLIQLEALDANTDTQQVVADWHYWVNQGYAFG